jgi:hypothetical protein
MDAAVRERCGRRLVNEGFEDGGDILSARQEAHDIGVISHREVAPAVRELLLASHPQPWNVTELSDGWRHRAEERTWESVEPRDRVGSGTPPSQGALTEM